LKARRKCREYKAAEANALYLRKTKIFNDGKEHVYWRLVESIRTASGPRQRTVACLGELNEKQQKSWTRIANQVDGRPIIRGLFESEEDRRVEAVKIGKVRVERMRRFGDVWLGLALWRKLGLDEFFAKQMEPGREAIEWDVMSCVSTIARFCYPSSELAIAERWVDQTALDDILGIDLNQINESRLYRTLDEMLPCKKALGEHLKQKYGELFGSRFDLLLYDVTSTYFEGEAKANSQAQRGYSRDSRPDCKQVTIALVATEEGLPLFYEVFDGNRTDVTMVEDIVEAMEKQYGKANRIWVMDRGMVSEENLEFLRERNGFYLVGTPKSQLRRFEQELLEKDWQEVQAGVEVKLCEEEGELFILCRSEGRKEKDRAIVKRFEKRIETRLEKLKKQAEKGRLKKVSGIERRIGKILGQNTRAESLFEVMLEKTKTGKTLRIEKNETKRQWAELSEGCYLLRTNYRDKKDPKDLWKTYIQLTEIEETFRILKSEMNIRPVWHKTQERVQSHIFVCFLALVMYRTLSQWMQGAGIGNSPRKLIEELANLHSMDVVLPLQEGPELRLRCVSQPEKTQQILLDRLKIYPPKRINRIKNVVPTLGV
jgi:transposase